MTLAGGDNVIKVKVTAEDTTTSLTYTVTVNRPAAPTCTLNTGDIWCGVVTVGTVIDQHGVTTGHGFEGTTGDLSDKMFTVGTNPDPYTISAIRTGSGNAAGYLSLALTEVLSNADENDLVLHVDNDSFAFSAASRNRAAYNWASSGLDWSDGNMVTLRLRGAAAANVAPAVTSAATFNPAENQTTVGTVEASDSDTDDEVTGYALSGGADQALFSINDSGVLTFQAAPNYEDPEDAGTNNAYEVTVQATSGTGGRVQTNTQPITVTVTNADEGQTETVSIDDTSPMVDDELTASTADVADPDGLPNPFAPTWQWYRTPAGGSETEFSGATSATYMVVEADLGAALTAKASWTDMGAFPNTLTSAPTDAVTAKVSAALPELSVVGASATEGSVVTFTVTLSEASTQAVTATFTVATVDDSTDEDDDTFTLTLSTPSNATLAADPTATGTITDNDAAPTISVQDQTVNEGNQDPDGLLEVSGFPFRVTLSEVSEKRVRYRVRRVELASDTATDADLDSNPALYHGAQAIAAGRTVNNDEADVILDDALDEPDETFTLEIYDLGNATAGTQTRSTITIADDDDPPTVSVADAEATEGDGVEFAVTLSEASGWEVTVNWATTGGTATSDTDFTAASDTLTFMPGETAKTVTVQTTEDTTDEDDETFTLTLSSPSNVTLAADPTATGTIKDNDDPPMLSVAGGSAAEGSAVTFTVTLSAAATADVTATWTASLETGDTATDTLTIAAGQTTATFTVATKQDTTDEENETFTVTLSTPSSNATLAADPTASVADAEATEGDGVDLTVTLSAPSGKTVTVKFAATAESGDTATGVVGGVFDGADFYPLTNTFEFAPGETSKTRRVLTALDFTDEEDETFTMTLSIPSNATLGDATATGTIRDDDEPPSVSVADASATEGDPVEFAVMLSAASGKTVTATWTASLETGDTALDGDFTAASDTLIFMPGVTAETITVQTIEDTTDEDEETFTLTLSSPSNVTLAADPMATGTIKDNDDPPMLSVAGGSAAEGSAVTFTVTLSAVATADVTATWTASLETGDTAAAADFTDLSAATGTVTVTKGQTTTTFTVATAQDTTDEENETFTVTLSTPSSNATLAAAPTATGTINDDDAEPTLSIADSSASEGSAMTFTVTLTPASGKTVGVGWGLDTRGTASDADFSGATLGTVTFPPGDTRATRPSR